MLAAAAVTRLYLHGVIGCSPSSHYAPCLMQENGVQNDAEAECSGLEVTSAFTANVWEVQHLKLMPELLISHAPALWSVFAM